MKIVDRNESQEKKTGELVCIATKSPGKTTGRELGIQIWALHPTIRGSNPRRFKNQYTKSFGGLQ
jgi:hypothetical protein